MGHSGNPYGEWVAPSRLFNAYVNWSRVWRNWTNTSRGGLEPSTIRLCDVFFNHYATPDPEKKGKLELKASLKWVTFGSSQLLGGWFGRTLELKCWKIHIYAELFPPSGRRRVENFYGLHGNTWTISITHRGWGFWWLVISMHRYRWEFGRGINIFKFVYGGNRTLNLGIDDTVLYYWSWAITPRLVNPYTCNKSDGVLPP